MKVNYKQIAKTVAICAAIFGVAYLLGYGIGRGIRKIKDMTEVLKYPETARERSNRHKLLQRDVANDL